MTMHSTSCKPIMTATQNFVAAVAKLLFKVNYRPNSCFSSFSIPTSEMF